MARQVLCDTDHNSASRILNLPAPASSGEPARKADLDAAIQGLAWKDNVRVAAPGNININSPGASIDSISLTVGDRVLLPNQTTGSQNGIYVWNGASVVMTRAEDADTADELENAIVSVDEGTSAGASFRQSTVNFTLGTGTPTWASFGTAAAAASETVAGIAEIATQTETDTGTDDARIVTPLKLTNWSGRKKKTTQVIGDGSQTSFTVTHNWGTRDVHVEVYRNSGNYDTVVCDVQRPSTNAIAVVFASAPTTNQFTVVVIS